MNKNPTQAHSDFETSIKSTKTSSLRKFFQQNPSFNLAEYVDPTSGNTALHLATEAGSFLMLINLIKKFELQQNNNGTYKKEWLDVKNKEGFTALHLAVRVSNYVGIL